MRYGKGQAVATTRISLRNTIVRTWSTLVGLSFRRIVAELGVHVLSAIIDAFNEDGIAGDDKGDCRAALEAEEAKSWQEVVTRGASFRE